MPVGGRSGGRTRELVDEEERGVGGRIGERKRQKQRGSRVQVFCLRFPFISTCDRASQELAICSSSSWELWWPEAQADSQESSAAAEADARQNCSDTGAEG